MAELTSAVVAGSTGLVGGILVKELSDDQFFDPIVALHRSSAQFPFENVRSLRIDFDELKEKASSLKSDVLFLLLGNYNEKSWIKGGLSQSRFYICL